MFKAKVQLVVGLQPLSRSADSSTRAQAVPSAIGGRDADALKGSRFREIYRPKRRSGA